MGGLPRPTSSRRPRRRLGRQRGPRVLGKESDRAVRVHAGVGERGSLIVRGRDTGKQSKMTRQETFKRRIRQRMEKTGERYGAARRVLIEKSSVEVERKWASEPEMADDTLREATGRGWDEWC